MKNVVYVTGNENKARYFTKLIGLDIAHQPADVDEIQSLDQAEVVTAKAREAYKILNRPVLIEDTSLRLACMNRLPGTFIKWFIEEIGLEKICRLADADPDRRATASCIYAFYDGDELKLFTGMSDGKIPEHPRGDAGFGWNPVFIPDGYDQTLGEMDDKTFTSEYLKIKPIEEVRAFLTSKPLA